MSFDVPSPTCDMAVVVGPSHKRCGAPTTKAWRRGTYHVSFCDEHSAYMTEDYTRLGWTLVETPFGIEIEP